MTEARARKRARIWRSVAVAAFVLGAALYGLGVPGEWIVLGGAVSAGLEAASLEGWIKGHRAATAEEAS